MAVPPASAHDPIFVQAEQTTPDVGPYMPDGAISWALYGSVLGPGDTRGFEFDLRDGEELYISLLIPNLEPELSLTDDQELPVLELEAPDGTTRTLTNDMREPFDEPFSATSYVTLNGGTGAGTSRSVPRRGRWRRPVAVHRGDRGAGGVLHSRPNAPVIARRASPASPRRFRPGTRHRRVRRRPRDLGSRVMPRSRWI